MKLTKYGKDFVIIDEDNFDDLVKKSNEKIHLLKLNFQSPTKEKILAVVNVFTKTNRYVISNNIKIYNDVLKTTGKKYYIENFIGSNLISYLRKNNKILLNFNNLRDNELKFLLDDNVLIDLLHNLEVVYITQDIYNKFVNIFNGWDGNIIMEEE